MRIACLIILVAISVTSGCRALGPQADRYPIQTMLDPVTEEVPNVR
jgi:hypothetical protein